MNTTEKQFIDLLSNSIRNEVCKKKYDNVDWNELMNLSRKHKIEGLIYSALNKSRLLENIDEDKVNELKKEVFFTGVTQISNMSKLEIVFNEFSKENVPVIVLKGLVVREYYPQPEQRSMSDADIFVKAKDLNKSKKILIDLGYTEVDAEASHHIKYIKSGYPMIELHWHVMKRDGFSDELDLFEDDIWDRTIEVNVKGAKVLSLGYEDLALHLCMHMAAHLAASGFGVRQIADLVLLVEKKGHLIDWTLFINKAEEFGFKKFIIIMFKICNILFSMDIPKEMAVYKIDDEEMFESLISTIFDGGVYGKKDMASNFANQVAFNYKGKDSNATIGAIRRYFRFIFPSIETMSDKYSYARKIRILTPIAWIHHLFSGIFRKEYNFTDKIRFLTKGAKESVEKNKILSWMEL
ncbi:MAG: nucleotidyltransferase family protein [Clostridium sp.]|uniref:nucleotidyltransferase domain-containing protein n=1 Tax=Clostridium sp. TaxID=1506 RepID=UPI003991DF7E